MNRTPAANDAVAQNAMPSSDAVTSSKVEHPTPSFALGAPIRRHSQGAYELKFLVDDGRADAIREWARRRLAPDPHADPDLVDGYAISSVYLDTPRFDIYYRSPSFKCRKYRLRRYGGEPILWLEQKKKRHGRVHKRRLSIDDSNLVEQLLPTANRDWEGDWFRRRLADLRLSPVTGVTYRRTARVGKSAAGPIRLTVDTDIRIAAADGWQVRSCIPGAARILPDRQIVELKFSECLPTIFRELMEHFELLPTAFSKYRASVDVCRLALSAAS